jgi:AraC-like DNA-binding protein
MILPADLPELHLTDSCGRIPCRENWSRTRENSLALRDWEFWMVWKGRGWMGTKKGRFTIRPGFCALMRPGGIYDAGHDEEDRLGITYIHFDWERNSLEKKRNSERLPEFFELDQPDFFDALSRRVVGQYFQTPGTAAVLLRGLLLDLLRQPPWRPFNTGSEGELSSEQRIVRLMAAVRAETGGRLPSVSEMAARVHLSPAHFSRLFRKVSGQSPIQFLLDIRLSLARHLLRETSMSVAEIAERLGYQDVFFFSRQFKEKAGMPPSAYRGGNE